MDQALKCDTIYDTVTLNEIPKMNLCATGTVCRGCGNKILLLHHVETQTTRGPFIDVFVRCSLECELYVRLRVKLP